jgi:biopolymer transport protein TolR
VQIVLKPNGALSIGVKGKDEDAPETAPNRDALVQLRTIHEAHPDYPVLIAGDKESKYDDVIQLISEAKKLGITRVGLSTK